MKADSAALNDASASGQIVDLATALRWAVLPDDVKHAARRHFLDTCGAIIAGMQGDVARAVASVQAPVAAPAGLAVPGGTIRLTAEPFAFLCGSAAHGIELDDGYRQGSVHPGVAVVPAVLAACGIARVSGRDLLLSLVVGYETITALAGATHPALRERGFHPTSAVGPFGAAMAIGRLLGLEKDAMASALGIAGSAAGGLFAFLNGGAAVKRLHGGQAARGGLMSAVYAREGISAPHDVIEAQSGFLQAFAFGEKNTPFELTLPPDTPFRILDCYVKPHACCRHLQPAIEALISMMNEHGLGEDDVEAVEVEAYSIAARHAGTGWRDFASAQLSFPYVLALALRYGAVNLEHFEEAVRNDPAIAALTRKFSIRATDEMDALYPAQRPSRVTIVTQKDRFSAFAADATGCREMPLSDEKLKAKFHRLVEPVLGAARAKKVAQRLWRIEDETDVATLFEEMAL